MNRIGSSRMINSITSVEEGYKTLAGAVVYQAFCDLVDYYADRPRMDRLLHGQQALRFFQSAGLQMFTDIDGNTLIMQAQEEAAKIKRKRRPRYGKEKRSKV